MAPLPENNTPRFRVHYTVGVTDHTVQFRSGLSPAGFGGFLDDFFAAVGGVFYDSILNTVEFCASGQNVFNLVTTGAEGLTWGSTAAVFQNNAYFANFIGRTSGGRRVRAAIFGIKELGGNYRYVAGESAALSSGVTVLNTGTYDLQAIDGLTPVWKSYVNAGVNAYWQKQLRV